jgi:peptidoglycan-N-acetylglucosamine deacetylase
LSLSLDLDNLWSYMKTHGDAGWESFPSYLDPLVDIVIERLRRHRITVTVFVVGQDAALARNREALRRLAEAGHEIANHSFSHEPWFHLYSRAEVDREIGSAEEHIEAATGRKPLGFRGPGFSLTEGTLEALACRGYLYDATTYPTFLGPVARAYYFWQARGLSEEERRKRSGLFGSAREGLRSLRPYLWEVGERELLEIPVTTLPGLRTPIHMSYVLYLVRFSRSLALSYLAAALRLCAWLRIQPSFLLHPLDFLGGDRIRELSFFPGMALDTQLKLAVFDQAAALLKRFQVVTVGEHARSLLSAADDGHPLPRRSRL